MRFECFNFYGKWYFVKKSLYMPKWANFTAETFAADGTQNDKYTYYNNS